MPVISTLHGLRKENSLSYTVSSKPTWAPQWWDPVKKKKEKENKTINKWGKSIRLEAMKENLSSRKYSTHRDMFGYPSMGRLCLLSPEGRGPGSCMLYSTIHEIKYSSDCFLNSSLTSCVQAFLIIIPWFRWEAYAQLISWHHRANCRWMIWVLNRAS